MNLSDLATSGSAGVRPTRISPVGDERSDADAVLLAKRTVVTLGLLESTRWLDPLPAYRQRDRDRVACGVSAWQHRRASCDVKTVANTEQPSQTAQRLTTVSPYDHISHRSPSRAETDSKRARGSPRAKVANAPISRPSFLTGIRGQRSEDIAKALRRNRRRCRSPRGGRCRSFAFGRSKSD